MKVVFAVVVIFLVGYVFILNKINMLEAGKKKVEEEISNMKFAKLSPFGEVKHLTILPLVDYYAVNDNLSTEPGVSYLIRADDTNILMDLGRNLQATHPSPLIQNMDQLGVKLEDIDFIFLSHLHLDHVGGMEEQRQGTFSLSKGHINIGTITTYAPEEVKPSSWNPNMDVRVVNEPEVIKPGVASIGPHPRYLFVMGYTLEQSLAINVEGKGIVLIVGCGHQTVDRILERARELFDEPIYAIIGGLHFPVNGGRIKKGPLDLQYITATDNPPWHGLKENDVYEAIYNIKSVKPRLVSLSPHDSSDWAIEKFKEAFGSRYEDLLVGKEIKI